jgi:uncharacterized membrane protein (GlpM family)
VFTRYETTQMTTQKLVLSSCAFAIPTLTFLLVLYFLMSRWSFSVSISAAAVVWLVAVLLLLRTVPL